MHYADKYVVLQNLNTDQEPYNGKVLAWFATFTVLIVDVFATE